MDEALFQDVAHVDDLPLLGDTHVALGTLFSCVARRPFYFTRTILFFSSFQSFLVGFDEKVMQVCGDIMGLGSWESFKGPLRSVELDYQ